jgi:hypothetical protein
MYVAHLFKARWVLLCTTCIKIIKLFILPTEYFYMFRIVLTMKNNYVPNQH